MKSSSHLASRPAYFVYGAIVVVAAVIVGAMFVSPLLSAKQQFATYNVDSEKVAIHGYDTVAYFTDAKPTKGKEEFEHVWEDARWQFASVTNRELFKANPERYAPQFGGYCAGGLAVGEYADGDPKLFTIVDGKLYFIKNEHFLERWREAPEAHVEFAEYNWTNFRDELRDNYDR
jgi:YHS domain-containing protein